LLFCLTWLQNYELNQQVSQLIVENQQLYAKNKELENALQEVQLMHAAQI